MDTLTALIIEDDLSFALNLEINLQEMGFENVEHKMTGSDALEFLSEEKPDLALIDIHLPGEINGLKVARQLKKDGIPILFLTGDENEETYNQARTLNPIAYLVKPVHRLSLRSTLEKNFFPRYKKSTSKPSPSLGDHIQQDTFVIKQSRNVYKVKFENILWVQADGNYCNVYTADRKYVIKLSLRRIFNQLPANDFIRVHRSAIVRRTAIQQIDLDTPCVQLPNFKVPLGPKYREEVLQWFSQY